MIDKKYFQVMLLIIISCFSSSYVLGTTKIQLTHSSETNSGAIELFDLIEAYAIPQNESYNVQNWDVLANDDRISWKTDGVSWSEKNQTYFRRGAVIVQVNNKKLFELHRRTVDHRWSINLLGSRSGVSEIKISSDGNFHELDGFDLGAYLENRKASILKKECDNNGGSSFGAVLYAVKSLDRNKYWLIYEWSCGTVGCSASISIYFIGSQALSSCVKYGHQDA